MRFERLILVVSTSAIASAAIVIPFAIWQRAAPVEEPANVAPLATAIAVPEDGESESTAVQPFVEVTPRPMTMLPSGLQIGVEAPSGWSHLVLHAVPRVAEGDVDRVSALVNKLSGLFHLVIVADIHGSNDAETNCIKDVAVGLATDVQGVETTVSSRSLADAKVKLDFMERTALGQNEANLKTAQQVARTKTMFVFDTETIMWRDNDHLRTIYRHAVLVAPETGRVATLIWALAPGAKGRYRFWGDSLQLLPNGLREDRLLHVDASKFTLGIPTQESFALIRLPPGKAVPASPAVLSLTESRFDLPEDALRLEASLRQAIGWDGSAQQVSAQLSR